MFPTTVQELLAPVNDDTRGQEGDSRHTSQGIKGFDVRDIERRSGDEDVAPLVVCCAVWSIIMSRYTSRDFVDFIKTGVTCRGVSQEWSFDSPRSFRATIDEDKSFSELLYDTSSVHSYESKSNTVTEPLNVVLWPHHLMAGSQELAWPPIPESDITVQLLSSHPKTIQAICRHSNRLAPLYVEKMVHHFLLMLRHVINHRKWGVLCLRDLPMTTLEEELQLRKESSPSCTMDEMSLGSVHQLVRLQARKTPDRAALEGAGHTVLCYREVDLISDFLAEYLGRHLSSASPHHLNTGLATESAVIVGIMLQRSPAVVVAILSCWKAGYAVVLLDPTHPISRNDRILEDCKAAMLLVDETYTAAVEGTNILPIDLEHIREKMRASDDAAKPCQETDLDLTKDLFTPAWIKVTSGSTGRPKCTVHNHATIASSISSFKQDFRGSKTLLFLNPISSASGNPIWTFLTNGGCVCIPAKSEIMSDLSSCINRYNIDDLNITPSALSLVEPAQVPGLRTVTLVGEVVSYSVGQAWSPYVALQMGYGATEMNAHFVPFHDEPTGTLPPAYGFPRSDYSLYILRPASQHLCPLFVPGEICLSSTHMSSGYINNADGTSKAFIPHPFPIDSGHPYIYRTGDLGMLIGERRFIFLGRVDFQFKIDGNRVQPEEIETMISGMAKVQKCRVVLVRPSVGPPISTCCVMLKESQDPNADNLWEDFILAAKRSCADELPEYMIPHRWLRFDEFPETPTAKIDKKALATEAQAIIDAEAQTCSGPLNKSALEGLAVGGKLFLDLAMKLFTGSEPGGLSSKDRDRIYHRSFLANGGSSLLSLRLRSDLRKQGFEISISSLYSQQSLTVIASSQVIAYQEAGSEEFLKFPPYEETAVALSCKDPAKPTASRWEYDTIFPATNLQREMFAMSLLDPKLWIFYQFLDLSQLCCTMEQIEEAIAHLVSAKPNLRTTFLVGIGNVRAESPKIKQPEDVFNFITGTDLFQAVSKARAAGAALPLDDEIEQPHVFWHKDKENTWSAGQPLWRVTFLTKPKILAWTLHHAIVDQWIARNISHDLHEILVAIMARDSHQQGWQQALSNACTKACKPSMEQWAIAHEG